MRTPRGRVATVRAYNRFRIRNRQARMPWAVVSRLSSSEGAWSKGGWPLRCGIGT